MKKINISGAGLVGSLMAILARKLGNEVHVFEKRKDLRKDIFYSGRSINLALSNRGLRALQLAGIEDKIKEIAIPMYGRMIHTREEKPTLQAYSHKNECIYSISRADLNKILIYEAENAGVSFHFEELLPISSQNDDLSLIAEGIHSISREKIPNHNTKEYFLDYSYKEFHIEATQTNDFKLEPNALHIWPNKNHMFIALPNQDKTFTCTLFLANTGDVSFESIQTEKQIEVFFNTYYPEISTLIPDYNRQFNDHPTSVLTYIKVEKWYEENFILIGDSAHAIVPFYGQGMNAGFEDCSVLHDLLHRKTERLGKVFQDNRKKNSDAICELALQNFIEMRDKVIDETYLDMRRVEAIILKNFSDTWLTQYEMVTFSNLSYQEAKEKGEKQKAFIQSLLQKNESEILEETKKYLKENS